MDFFSIHGNCAALRAEQSVKNIHQGGFAGAVLTDQGVDFRFFNQEGHIIVGRNQGKGLGYVTNFDGIVCHGFASSTVSRPIKPCDDFMEIHTQIGNELYDSHRIFEQPILFVISLFLHIFPIQNSMLDVRPARNALKPV